MTVAPEFRNFEKLYTPFEVKAGNGAYVPGPYIIT